MGGESERPYPNGLVQADSQGAEIAPATKSRGFTEKQLEAIAIIAGIAEGDAPLSTAEIARRIGVAVETLRRWREGKRFSGAIAERARAIARSSSPEVYARMLHMAKNGDRAMIKLFVERFGEGDDSDSRYASDIRGMSEGALEELTITARRLKVGHHKED